MRFQAAIARRSRSASPGVKPAATIASCMTCSWKIGTPSVRESTLLDFGARVDDRLLPAPPAQVRMHHLPLDRSRTDDRDLDDEVVVTARREPRQHRHLRARLDLEHADRVRAADHLVHGRILGRNIREVEFRAAPRRDQRERTADRGQHAEAQHVDLEEPELVEIVLVPLDYRALRHRRVLDRNQLIERPARDHEAAGVLRQVPRKPDQLARQREHAPDERVRRIEASILDARVVDLVAVPPLHRVREAVDLRRRRDPSALPTSRTALFGR